MDELSWLSERTGRLAALREPELSAERLGALEREQGLEAALERRREIGIQLSGECFRAGLFDEAGRWFRRRLTATQQLADHLAQAGDEEGARREVEELARHAWAVGDFALFRRYVSEGCDPARDLRPRLDVYPAMFLSWAVLGERFAPEHWENRLNEQLASERKGLALSWQDESLRVAEGILVDSRLALCRHWQGDWEQASSLADRALRAFRDRGRHRPEGLSLPHVRAWRLRIEGLALLLRGRADDSCLEESAHALAKGLAATALTREIEWKDIVILRLTALAWRDAGDPSVTAFTAAFPQLAPLLERERSWSAESAAGRQ
jgi:tetratricopeptide (TPR) repeat protein